jgi:Arc/MetJ-type ribon-helix-helix transcriptional regulator
VLYWFGSIKEKALKVELTPDAAQWVQAEIAAGTFPTPEDAVRYAIAQAKLNALRNALDAAEAEGGSFTTDEVRRHAREHLDGLGQTPKGS